MNTKTKKTKRGFTITELVIVIAVIAILAAVLIPTFSNVINRANESAAMQEARSEWSNYSPEVATNDAEANDFLIAHAKDGTTVYFLVEDGQFNPDQLKGVKVTESTVSGLPSYTTVTAVENYDYQNPAVTIYQLSA